MITVAGDEPLEIQEIADEVVHLEFGDIVIEENGRKLIIERKRIGDFWSSLKSGRLNSQLMGCDALMIHGLPTEIEFFEKPEIYYDAVNGVSKHHHVFWVLNVKHLEDTVRRYERQMKEGTFGEFKLMHVKKKKLQQCVRMLAEIDGIGVEKAKMMLSVHKNMYGVISAAESMAMTDGIGEKTLDNITGALGEDYKEE